MSDGRALLNDDRIVLDDEAILARHEAALQDTRAQIRTAVNEMLDELGITDPTRRERLHAKAIERAMPTVRGLLAGDVEEFRRGDNPPVQH